MPLEWQSESRTGTRGECGRNPLTERQSSTPFRNVEQLVARRSGHGMLLAASERSHAIHFVEIACAMNLSP
jgi:hypothetical protein